MAKTQFINYLRTRLKNQNGFNSCSICQNDMEEIISDMEQGLSIDIKLTPDYNVSNICTGYHVELIASSKSKNQK